VIQILNKESTRNFCSNLEKNEIFEMLKQVYGETIMSRACVSEWCKLFSEGRDKVEFDSRYGRPTTSKSDENIEKLRTLVRNDRVLLSG
jgi:hypothetical protein